MTIVGCLPDHTPCDGYLTDVHHANKALRPRNVGVRLAIGPWRAIDARTFGVPVVTEMEHHPRPDFVIQREARPAVGFTVVKERKEEAREESDPLAVAR